MSHSLTASPANAEGNGAPDGLPERPMSEGASRYAEDVRGAALNAIGSITQLRAALLRSLRTVDGLNEIVKAHGYEPVSADNEPERTLRWLEEQLEDLQSRRLDDGDVR